MFRLRSSINQIRRFSTSNPPNTNSVKVATDNLKQTTASSARETSAKQASSTSSQIPQAVAALFLGTVTVSAASAIVEYGTASSCPKYDPKGERYDQSDFVGRFSKMLLACDPRLLLYTEAQVLEARKMLDNYQSVLDEQSNNIDLNRTLWEAKRIVNAAMHPDTGDMVPRPCRMSGYVPFNGPVGVAMVSSSSTPTLLFWNWINQSQNAGVNFFNRNASSPMSNETLVKSYAGAVGAALTVALGLSTLVNRRFSPEQASKVMRFVAFPSTVIASSLNCYIVRSPEIDTGVPIINARGEQVLPGEMSTEAAKRGVYSTTASRAILNIPVLLVPPVLTATIPPLRRAIAANAAAALPITTYLLLVSFGIGLPAACAIFPQISEIDVMDLESKFHGVQDPATGKSYEKLYYNKGL